MENIYFNTTDSDAFPNISDANFTTNFNQTALQFVIPLPVVIFMYVMYTSISCLAIGGNGIVCYLVFTFQKMRTVTNFFIVNLSVGDVLMASLCIPFGFVSNILLQYWPFGIVMCVIVSYTQAVSVFVSSYTLVAISFDRYMAIIYPLRPRITKFSTKLIISCIWIVALVTPLPTMFTSGLFKPPDYAEDRAICTEIWDEQNQRFYYSIALMCLQYFLPLLVLVFTYCRIGIVVWGKRMPGEAEDNRDQRVANSKLKMIKMMLTVVIVFTLCWLPLNTFNVIIDIDVSVLKSKYAMYVWFVCHWLAMSHTVYNPFIYCWMNSKFREGYFKLYSRVFCKNQRNPTTSMDLHMQRCNTYSTCTSFRNTSGKRFLNNEFHTTISKPFRERNGHHNHQWTPFKSDRSESDSQSAL